MIVRKRLIHTILAAFGAITCLAQETPTSAPAPSSADEVMPGFRNLSFDAAVTEAKKSNKVIFVDFYTTWCGPCKMLDRSTFKDSEVVKLLREKTVAIKVDADKERDLAARYGVSSYPSLVVLKSDGTEIGRLLGYRDAQQFRKEAADLFQGITTLERAKMDVQGEGKNDPMKHHRLADEYANAGKYDEAMKEYLWCFDHGMSGNPEYVGVRSSYLLARLAQLSQFHAPVRDAVLERRDAAGKRLVENPQDRLAAIDYASINRQFGQNEQTLAMFDRLRDSNQWDGNVRLVLRDALFDELFTQKRYADLLAGDAVLEVEHDVERLKQMEPMFARDPLSKRQLRARTMLKWSRLLEATLATRPRDAAERLARTILAYDSSKETVDTLTTAAVNSGKQEFSEFLQNPTSMPATSQPQ